MTSVHKTVSATICAVCVCLPSTPRAQAPAPDAQVESIVAAVSKERLAATIQTLAAFGTRQLYSDTASPTRGIGAAREWIRQQFIAAGPKLQVSFDVYQVACPVTWN